MTPLAQIVAQKNSDFNGLGMVVGTLPQRQRPGRSDGGPNFAPRVLIEHDVDGP